MLQEYLLVPETIIRPNSFVGLMSLYESNFLRLQQVIPEIDRLDGCFRSRVAGNCDLHVEFFERSRYTVTLSLSYVFDEHGERIADPDMLVRVYFDGRLAESMALRGDHRDAGITRLAPAHRVELEARWRRNIILNKWLEYLVDQGHMVLER
jgi:uncharacterized protein YqiB (DUF1249 family)